MKERQRRQGTLEGSAYNSGQALLIILLTLAVALTVVLSAVSRSVVEISITSYEEEAQRAFDAAEAGIEEVLVQTSYSSVPKTNLPDDTTYQVDISNPIPPNNEFVYQADLFAGQSATFWFVSHKLDGSLTCDYGYDCVKSSRIDKICWGVPSTDAGTSTTPAIEISLFYDPTLAAISSPNDYSNVKIARFAFDPNASRMANEKNNFYSVSAGCSGGIANEKFSFSTGTIRLDYDTSHSVDLNCPNTPGCLLLAKVKMIYNRDLSTGDDFPHPVGLDIATVGSTSMPAQGTQIESTGESGESTRKVNVFESYPEPPFVFDAAIFGLGGLAKPF